MKSRRYPPAYFRYFRARLWNLTRPSIWGTAIFLSVVGLAIKEYWIRPDIFTNRQSKPVATQQEPNPLLSPEDRAKVADIDNLPVLVYDSNFGAIPKLDAAEPVPKTQNKSTSEEAISKQKTTNDVKLDVTDNSAPSPKADNPFLKQADNLLQLSNIQRNNRFLGLNASKSSRPASEAEFLSGLDLSGLNTGEVRKNNSSDRAVMLNPLQAALDLASKSQNSPNLSSGSSNLNSLQSPFNSNQTNLSNPSLNTINGFGQLQPTDTLPNQGTTQPYTSPTGLTPTADAINRIPNSTGYAQPTATNVPQTYNGNYSNGSITQPQTYNSNYNGNLNTNLNSNLNNNQSLPSTTQSIPITPVTLPVPNYTMPYSLNLNRTGVPANTQINNGALIDQGLQQSNQVQQYNYSSSPIQVPNQYPSAGQAIRY